MPPIRKNVRLAAWLLLCAAVAAAFSFTQLGLGILVFIYVYHKIIGYLTVLAVCCGAVFWVIKARRLNSLGRKIAAASSLPLIGYACACLWMYFFPTEYSRCNYYNQELNGGMKVVNGKNYKVNLCGAGADSQTNDDEVRLH